MSYALSGPSTDSVTPVKLYTTGDDDSYEHISLPLQTTFTKGSFTSAVFMTDIDIHFLDRVSPTLPCSALPCATHSYLKPSRSISETGSSCAST